MESCRCIDSLAAGMQKSRCAAPPLLISDPDGKLLLRCVTEMLSR